MYRLALRTGRVNVDRLGRELTARQLQEWIAYETLEPFEDERNDYRFAALLQLIANVNRDPKKPAFKLDDFLLLFGDAVKPEKPKQDWREMKAIATLFTMAEKAK